MLVNVEGEITKNAQKRVKISSVPQPKAGRDSIASDTNERHAVNVRRKSKESKAKLREEKRRQKAEMKSSKSTPEVEAPRPLQASA